MKALGFCQRCYGRRWAKDHQEERRRSILEFRQRNPGYATRLSRRTHAVQTYGLEWADAAVAMIELRKAIKRKEKEDVQSHRS